MADTKNHALSSSYHPATQQSPMPGTSSSAALNHFYREKRHYLSVAQLHMAAIRDEIQKMAANIGERTLIAANHGHERHLLEEAAATYGDQQERLSIYNTILEVQSSKTRNDKLTTETNALQSNNQRLIDELDVLLGYKIHIEEEMAHVKREIEAIDKAHQNIVASLPAEDKVKYVQLFNENQHYMQVVDRLQEEIKQFREMKRQLETNIGNNSMKQQHLKLLQDTQLQENQKTSLTKQLQNVTKPGDEREQLIAQVKSDKSDIEAMGEMRTALDAELTLKHEKLDDLEHELNEKNVARLRKHKELRERNVQMTSFIDAFPERAQSMRDKMAEMQRKIVAALNQLTNAIADLNFEEVDNIHEGMQQPLLEGLQNQGVVLASRLNRLQQFKTTYEGEIISVRKKRIDIQKGLIEMREPERARDLLVAEREAQFEELVKLKGKLESTMAAVREAEKQETDLEASLSKNDMYGEIVRCEKRMATLEERNAEISKILNVTLQQDEINAQRETIRNLCARRNGMLIMALKHKKVKHLVEYDNYENLHNDDGYFGNQAVNASAPEILKIE